MNTLASILSRHTELSTSDSSRLDCELLLCEVLKKDRAYLYTWPEKELGDEQLSAFFALFERRKQGEPIAHIVGRKEFWSLSLQVDTSTLIPRPETELLVECVLECLTDHLDSEISVLDLGTGTGAIALALASECPCWQVTGLDKQEDAVRLAVQNAKNLGLERVSFARSDWFEILGGRHFQVIVSNPPYIDATDHHLHEGDVRFEPKTALVADKQGMADLEWIIQSSPSHLTAGGWLLLEHGYQQAEPVQALLKIHGFKNIQTRMDLSGLPRVTYGQHDPE